MANELFFKEDTFPIISQILEANSIKESREDVIEKISNDKSLAGEVIINIAEKIVLENLQEKDACLFLQEQLNITEQSAKQVYVDIQKKILPMAQTKKIENRLSKEKPITARPDRLINKNIDDNKKTIKPKNIRAKIIETPIPEKPEETAPKITQKRVPDSYREPIG